VIFKGGGGEVLNEPGAKKAKKEKKDKKAKS